MVAQLGGGVIAAQVVRVKRDFYPYATPVAAACGLELRKAPNYRLINRLQRASADLAGGCYRLPAAKSDPTVSAASIQEGTVADLPVVIVLWDQMSWSVCCRLPVANAQ
jgi:hypothetical protein